MFIDTPAYKNPRSVGAKCTLDIIGVKSTDIALLTELCVTAGLEL